MWSAITNSIPSKHAHHSGTTRSCLNIPVTSPSLWGRRRSCIAVVGCDVIALHLVAGEDKGNNETVQTESLGEDENKDNTDEQLWLASVRSDTSITDNANGNTSGETGHTAAKPSS